MSQNAERYLLETQSEYLKKFEKELGGVEDLTIGLWKSIITIHSVILGVSVAISGYLEVPPNFFLKSAWILMIFAIGLGFFIFKFYIDQKRKGAWTSLRFSMDMNALHLSDVKGEFSGNEEKKIGMFVAIIMNQESDFGIPEKNQLRWTDDAKKLAKRYKGELQNLRSNHKTIINRKQGKRNY